jgi:hypothetical protein
MFDWIAKRRAKAAHEAEQKRTHEADLKEWKEKGRRAAEQFTAEVDAYTAPRFALIQNNYMQVFRERLDGVETDLEMPPLRAAGVEQQAFMRNARKLQPELVEEICSVHAEWLETFARIGTEAEMRGFIASKVDAFIFDMFEISLKEITDTRYDQLTALDDAWRAANPEKSAKFPLTSPPESD